VNAIVGNASRDDMPDWLIPAMLPEQRERELKAGSLRLHDVTEPIRLDVRSDTLDGPQVIVNRFQF
jgi:hypothetical protein